MHDPFAGLRLAGVAAIGVLTAYGTLVIVETVLSLIHTSVVFQGQRRIGLGHVSRALRWSLLPDPQRWRGQSWQGADPRTLAPILMIFLMPLSFLLFPRTFARARVRRVHILRIFAYSLIPAPLIFGCLGLINRIHAVAWELSVNQGWTRRSLPWPITRHLRLLNDWPWTLSVIIGAFLAAWWMVAARDYLRLPRAWALALSAAVAAGLAANGLILLISDMSPAGD